MNLQQYEMAGSLLLEKQRLEETLEELTELDKNGTWVHIQINTLRTSLKRESYKKLVEFFKNEIDRVSKEFKEL